ncbi:MULTISPECIES: hypothetical protein [unclassified Burkholderia]|uniref:hypothetical protein n=1 Tax=unclassified Burkholderia TaxID=2613784 RepID=UPI000F55B93A|nr:MULTISPECIES: hypothetical protein [unclassified Burkholderia]RQR35796.1 hypothetical protein DIE20_26980 [Burkholderia sp. Bp9131]RQR63527.1 hypothetical protein DIE12_33810 [Burkholderia sp. Bp9015]RQS29735.1 hypothetical protein DIE05_12035 [Burkholderia sp. Bp8995]RQS47831.1 hypothetical protein DIE00_12615 [Burkholderia sp. Bp8989]RQZ38418.1 hypothetical protein DIE16_15170 [Burkholderia sp. Bp9090]
MNADSRVQRNRAPYRGPVFGGDAVSAGKEKRVRDVRAVAFVAPAPVPLAFRRPDAMEQRGGVQQFGIECDAAAHTDDRCKCEHAHRMQEQKFFPATSAQFIQIATASDSCKSKSGMAALLSHQTGSLVNRCFACCRRRKP